MSSKNRKLRVSLFVMILGVVASVPAFAGSAVIGLVAGSMNATIGGQSVLPNTTILSGDSLQVSDGAAVVAIDSTSRLVFGRDTAASFLREADEVTVLLSQGNVSIYHPEDGVALRVQVGDVMVVPAKGFKTLGEVAMVGDTVMISAKDGKFQVEGNGSARDVAKGKTITLPAKASRALKPSPAGPALGGISASTALSGGVAAAGGTAAVMAGVGISRANDARDAANTANSTAGEAVSAANAADSDAVAAASAANAANSTAVLAGCAVDKVTPSVDGVSPFVPPAGSTCP